MNARTYLRDVTREAHDRVDALFSRYDLGRDEDYARFLTAHAAAYLPVERALDRAGAGDLIAGWRERRRGHLLLADLEALGLAEPAPVEAPSFDDEASVVGGAYVLEGSRLGGSILKGQVAATAPRAFLDPAADPGGWPKFIAEIERILYSRVRQEQAGKAALNTFACFEYAAR